MPIPDAEPGLVVSYSYLWHREHRAGQEEGRKNRASVVVLAVECEDGAVLVTILPITHTAPIDSSSAVEVPLPVKRHLGLGDDRSWIVVAEGNEFVWPGHDLRRRLRSDRYDYGFLPPSFFDRVMKAFVGYHRAGRRRVSARE
jgi:hypothetical protein